MDTNRNGIEDATEFRSRGNWNEVQGRAKQRWGNLTDEDLHYQEGHQDAWLGNLQRKTGETLTDLWSWFVHNS